jgi:hypothetical protein
MCAGAECSPRGAQRDQTPQAMAGRARQSFTIWASDFRDELERRVKHQYGPGPFPRNAKAAHEQQHELDALKNILKSIRRLSGYLGELIDEAHNI